MKNPTKLLRREQIKVEIALVIFQSQIIEPKSHCEIFVVKTHIQVTQISHVCY